MSDAKSTEAAEAATGGEESTDVGTGEGDEATVAAVRPPDADPDQERLQELDEQIRHAAQHAEETLGEPGQKFHESGGDQAEKADDQTIAPPG